MVNYIGDVFAEGLMDEETILLQAPQRTHRKSKLQEEYRNRKLYGDQRTQQAKVTGLVCLLGMMTLMGIVVYTEDFDGMDVTSFLEQQDTTNRHGQNSTIVVNGTVHTICDMEGHGVCLKRVWGICTEHGPCVEPVPSDPTPEPTISPGEWDWQWGWPEWDFDDDYYNNTGDDDYKQHGGGGLKSDDDMKWNWDWHWPEWNMSNGDHAHHGGHDDDDSGGNSTDDWEWGWPEWQWGFPAPAPAPGPGGAPVPGPAPAPGPWEWGWGTGDSGDPIASPTPMPSTTTDCNPWDPPCKYDAKDLHGVWFCVEVSLILSILNIYQPHIVQPID